MIIRHTPLQQLDQTNRQINDLKSRFERQTQVATTQLEVLSSEDAAGAWQQIDRLQNALADQDVFEANAGSAMGLLDTMDVVLRDAANEVSRARELAVQLSNDSYNDADRAEVAVQVTSIRDSVLALANTQMADRSLFAGTAYDDLAFAADGTYQGNTDVSTVRVSQTSDVPTSAVGEDIFRTALDTLDALATALGSGAGSAAATAAELGDLDTSHETLVRARQNVGFDQVEVLDARSIADSLRLTLQESLNARVAADPIESLSTLAELRSSYEVALQVTASTGSTTLFDFLR
ncbi:MAG: hypothetical protein KTR31_02845 [Myxococcales bacterium]|nr:hypothetical protein [Myxococcales bacterium]